MQRRRVLALAASTSLVPVVFGPSGAAAAGPGRPTADGPSADPGTSARQVELGDLTSPSAPARAESGAPADVPMTPSARRLGSGRAAGDVRTLRFDAADLEPFSLVGLTWTTETTGRAAPPTAREVSTAVRTRAADGSWSPWSTLDVQDDADHPAARGGTDPLWTGSARAIEVVLTGTAARQPRDVRLELIDPARLDADRNLAPSTSRGAKGDRPEILTRAKWGADESKMTWKPTYSDTIRAICFHHTQTSNDYGRDDVPAILRSIYHYHSVSNGWGDIGYNVVVDRFGRIWEGRYGGVDRPVIGAHAGGFNNRSGGIALLGDFMKADVPQPMKEAAAGWIAWKLGTYDRDPNGTVKLEGGPNTKYKEKTTVTLPSIWPHRKTSDTDCPGEGGMRALPDVRKLTTDRMH